MKLKSKEMPIDCSKRQMRAAEVLAFEGSLKDFHSVRLASWTHLLTRLVSVIRTSRVISCGSGFRGIVSCVNREVSGALGACFTRDSPGPSMSLKSVGLWERLPYR